MMIIKKKKKILLVSSSLQIVRLNKDCSEQRIIFQIQIIFSAGYFGDIFPLEVLLILPLKINTYSKYIGTSVNFIIFRILY